MNKNLRLVFVFVFIVALFIAAPATVLACTPTPAVEDEEWLIVNGDVTGKPVRMEELDKIAGGPQLLSDGIQLDAASKICYPFEKGRYGWVGVVYQSVNGAWVKLPTTNGWLTSAEGSYMACTQAKTSGTYALFGSYIK